MLAFTAPALTLAVAAAGAAGALIGAIVARQCIRLTPLPHEAEFVDRVARRTTPVAAALFYSLLVAAMLGLDCQTTPEVRPDPLWRWARIVSHLALVALLVAATATDLRDYVIPDAITIPGIVLGVAFATLSGDLQIIHLWVDWNDEVPGLRGPWIPEWLSRHPHWHGLAWSLAGAAVGGGLTWLVRALSRAILGREAMGFGDVTLMAMIGSFLGWQPTLVAFLIAPLCGVIVAAGARLAGGKSYVPYGPFLAAGAFVVLCSWRWIWMWEAGSSPAGRFRLRDVFGDATALGLLAAIALAAFAALLGAIRLYRAIPGVRGREPVVRNGGSDEVGRRSDVRES